MKSIENRGYKYGSCALLGNAIFSIDFAYEIGLTCAHEECRTGKGWFSRWPAGILDFQAA